MEEEEELKEGWYEIREMKKKKMEEKNFEKIKKI